MRIRVQVVLALVAAAAFSSFAYAQSTEVGGGAVSSMTRDTPKSSSPLPTSLKAGADVVLDAAGVAAPFIPGGAVVSAAVNGGGAAASAADDGAAAGSATGAGAAGGAAPAGTARQTPKTDFGGVLGQGASRAADLVVNVPQTPSTPIDVTPMPRETLPIVRPAVRPVLTTTPAFAPVPVRQPATTPLPQPVPITQPIKVDQPVILQPQPSPILIRR